MSAQADPMDLLDDIESEIQELRGVLQKRQGCFDMPGLACESVRQLCGTSDFMKSNCRKTCGLCGGEASMSGLQRLGCWKDTSNRAIPTMEGKGPMLDGHYKSRTDAVMKCRDAAEMLGYTVFAVQNGGWCASSANAMQTFWKYGRSSACKEDGEGGPWANEVYMIRY